MKQQLSLVLLTLSIFSINLLPAQAATKNRENSKSVIFGDGQWCVQVPSMGIFCWDL